MNICKFIYNISFFVNIKAKCADAQNGKRGEYVKKLAVCAALFAAGAVGYMLIELAWRGRTHILMGAAGGLCLNIICAVSKIPRLGLAAKSAFCSAYITAVELAFGVVFNIGMGLDIWDYSDRWGNFLGQICPEYSFYWFVLSLFLTSAAVKFGKTYDAAVKRRLEKQMKNLQSHG